MMVRSMKMSEEKHLFPLKSVWTGDSDSDGVLKLPWGAKFAYGIPEATGGKPGRSNPEEMLVAAVVSCYSITYAILAEKKRLVVPEIEVEAEGEVVRQPDRTLKFTAIRSKPKITLVDGDEGKRKIALDIAHKAEKYCLVSNAIRGNVEVSVEPEIVEPL
jgi:peroxiredoxin-like protein